MKKLIVAVVLTLTANLYAIPGGSVSLEDGRIKIQFSVQSSDSKGSFGIRGMLEKHGFENKDGFVRTEDALEPLELYNYLYDNGRFVFSMFLPFTEDRFFVSYDEKGFVHFKGIAAQRLFEVVKHYGEKSPLSNLEQYKWDEHAYCDRTVKEPIEYRCFFHI